MEYCEDCKVSIATDECSECDVLTCHECAFGHIDCGYDGPDDEKNDYYDNDDYTDEDDYDDHGDESQW